VLSGNERVGAVRISAPEAIVSGRVDRRIRGLLFVALLSLLIASVVAWLFARSVSRPLGRLSDATDRLAAGDLSTRAETDAGPPEVRDLAASFNSMADRLEQLVDRQRAFAGTASHQLRTPLTALRLRLEQLAADVAEVDESDPTVRVNVESAVTEADRLHRMIEGLLALSRAEDAAVGPIAVDIGLVLRARADYWGPLADESGVTIDVAAPDGIVADAIPGGVEQIVDNLVDNALEVSPPGSRLAMSVAVVAGVAELHVVDEGPGLSASERSLAFDRYWRAEDASAGGSGLGLAIVEQLAEAGGGSAELREAPSGGIDAVVRFRM
jgi:signal transduction histidine kinase